MEYILYTLLGGAGRRALGGAVSWPRGVTMFVLAGLAVLIAWPVLSWWSLVVGALTVLFWSMGHGSYMDMGTVDKTDNERFAPWLDKIFGKGSTGVDRDYLGMTIRYTIPAMFVCTVYLFKPQFEALILLLVGILIATGYLIFSIYRKRLPHNNWFDGATGYGEIWAGIVYYGALSLISLQQ